MDSRGFGARNGRTSIIQFELTRTDRVIMIALLVAIVAGLVLLVVFGRLNYR